MSTELVDFSKYPRIFPIEPTYSVTDTVWTAALGKRFAIIGRSSFYIRSCYEPMWHAVDSWLQTRGDHDNCTALVTGTPGIGKSCFLIYAIKRILDCFVERQQHDACIILDVVKRGVFKISANGSVYRAESLAVLELELMYSSNYYLYDARPDTYPTDGISAKIIIAASPNRQHYSQLQKEPRFRRFFMPLWSLDELELCRKLCYKDIQHSDVVTMFAQVGGVAQSIFAADEDERTSIIQELDRAVNGATFSDVLGLLGTDALFDKYNVVSHRLLHFSVQNDDFLHPMVTFASKHIGQQILVKASLDDLRACYRFVFNNDVPSTAGLRGGALTTGDQLLMFFIYYCLLYSIMVP